MKKMMSYLIVVFSLFGFNSAHADNSCESKSVKLSEMKFLGMSLRELLKNPDDCTIIPGVNTDNAADKKCNKAALNPGNPQYGSGPGQNGSNSLGYYFCVNMNKQDMCLKRKAALGDKMDIRWAPLAGAKAHHNSGDCKCKSKGDSASEEVNCPSDPTALLDGNATGCTVDGAQLKKSDNQCHCLVDDSIVATGGKCPEPVVEKTENVDDNDLNECIADLKAAKASCSEKGKAAIDKCSKEAPEVNKNISEAQRVLSIGLDAVIAKNAGTGALGACAKMGAAGTSVIEALGFLRESCKKELESCKKGCEDVATLSKKTDAEYIAECKAKFQAATPPKLFSKAHEERLVTLLGTQRALGDNAEKFCKGDVQKSDGQLANFIDELAANVQKADICKCQLTSSSAGTENCDNVAGPLTCMQNINQPGCSFSSVGCSPNSTIAGCRNPVATTNPNGSGIAMPASGFAGPGFGSTGGGSNAGKVGVSGDDFGGLYDETRPSGSGTATADAGSPFGVAAGGGSGAGGVGGVGSGGSGEGSGSGAAGEEKDKGGLSGFFQNTKAGIASLFGGGADNKGSTTKKPDNKAYKNDVNGFRPKAGVRGMANANEFGSKNRDIWKTMNERYNDQYHTFITVENPPK